MSKEEMKIMMYIIAHAIMIGLAILMNIVSVFNPSVFAIACVFDIIAIFAITHMAVDKLNGKI